jgi:N-acyl homoserine lactone hydrolase
MGSSVVEVGFERPPAAAVVRGYVRADANSSVAAQPDGRGSVAASSGRPSVITLDDVRRVDLGYFVRPAEETATGQRRVEPCLGYVVRLADVLLILDTGMGEHPAVDERYRPFRRPLPQALSDIGVDLDEVTHVVNCHLHFDHCGGNPLLAGRPVYTQSIELEEARSTERYTLPELVDFTGVRYEVVDGEVEIFPDVWLVPTPGHTRGHQALAVRCDDGTVVLAGQAHDNAAAFTADQLAWRAEREHHQAPVPSFPDWVDRLMRFDPRRVYFAHDNAVWEPPSTSPGQQIGRRSAR